VPTSAAKPVAQSAIQFNKMGDLDELVAGDIDLQQNLNPRLD